MTGTGPLTPLPDGIGSRFVEGVNGLTMHILEAGDPERPMLLLLHGFPELAYSWRKVMGPLARLGYHVVAPDLRGYGRTTGWSDDYDADIAPFRFLGHVRDAVALVYALGRREVAAVIGHDFGSPAAAWCALARPDMFQAVALMSAPFAGPPPLPFGGKTLPPALDIPAALAALPRPRKHYQWYYATREANQEMLSAPQGLHAFFRAYYHSKSADWAGNDPHPLPALSGEALAEMPEYYIMDMAKGMAETVAPWMPSAEEIAANAWLPDAELAVYVAEYARTGFQGGLNWYRCNTSYEQPRELFLFTGRAIDVPAVFIGGEKDWGLYQRPGAIEAMQANACRDFRGRHIVPNAGHWVQQEQPDAVVAHLAAFLAGLG